MPMKISDVRIIRLSGHIDSEWPGSDSYESPFVWTNHQKDRGHRAASIPVYPKLAGPMLLQPEATKQAVALP